MNWLLFPPIAFVLYLLLAGLLVVIGSVFAGPSHPNSVKSMTYASGEISPQNGASPGYQPFYRVALFFAILHLGALVLSTADFSRTMIVYLIGLIFVLIVLIVG